MKYYVVSQTLISEWKPGLWEVLKVSSEVLRNLFGERKFRKIVDEINDKGSFIIDSVH